LKLYSVEYGEKPGPNGSGFFHGVKMKAGSLGGDLRYKKFFYLTSKYIGETLIIYLEVEYENR
jgi:hypothetical protein